MTRRGLVAAVLALAVVAAIAAARGPGGESEIGRLTSLAARDGERGGGSPVDWRRADPGIERRKRCLETSRLERARRYAAHRSGSVAFAFLDECGRLVGEHRYRPYSSASVIKVMLLAAYLRQDGVADRELDDGERDLLKLMIEHSDNAAADAVFAQVGESGLDDVAGVAHMRRFQSSPYWGSSAITAGDQASFLGEIEHFLPKGHEDFALRILAGVTESQRWGIPQVKPRHWSIHFKGGWYPEEDSGWRVNQDATLRHRSRSFALAVLSEGNPSFGYGQETIKGVAKRLMGGYGR